MKPCDLMPADIACFTRKIVEKSEYDLMDTTEQQECEDALMAAKSMAANYTGLDIETCNFHDVTYAIKVIAAEMIDNHQVTAQYTGQNPVAMQILNLHSTNLLPKV